MKRRCWRWAGGDTLEARGPGSFTSPGLQPRSGHQRTCSINDRQTGPPRASHAAPLRQIEGRQPAAAVSAVHREGPLNPAPETLACAQARNALPFAGTIQSNTSVILHCPSPCCASETHTRAADPGGWRTPKPCSTAGGYPEKPFGKRVTREGFSEELLGDRKRSW